MKMFVFCVGHMGVKIVQLGKWAFSFSFLGRSQALVSTNGVSVGKIGVNQ